MMGWQWHQQDHMQIICILLQTDNHAGTSLDAFQLPNQQCQSTKILNQMIFNFQSHDFIDIVITQFV